MAASKRRTSDRFKLISDFKPTGDLPGAIEALTEGLYYEEFNHKENYGSLKDNVLEFSLSSC